MQQPYWQVSRMPHAGLVMGTPTYGHSADGSGGSVDAFQKFPDFIA